VDSKKQLLHLPPNLFVVLLPSLLSDLDISSDPAGFAALATPLTLVFRSVYVKPAQAVKDLRVSSLRRIQLYRIYLVAAVGWLPCKL